MIDKKHEGEVDTWGKVLTPIGVLQCQDDWAMPPPFHCEECPHGGIGSIIGDVWDPKPCKCMESQRF